MDGSSNSDDVQVTEVVHNNKYFTPVLVNFENGTLRKGSDLFKVDLYEDERDGKRRVISLYNEDESYEGNILQNENSLCHRIILLRNKKTNKVRLLETSQAIVKKVFKGDISEGNLMNEKTYNEYSKNDLSKKFGSKKSMRATEVGLRMNLANELIKDQVETTVAGVSVDNSDLTEVTAEQSLCNCLPPCNRSANDIKDVYRLKDILKKKERNSIAEEAQNILDKPPNVNDSRYSFYFNMLFQKMGTNIKLKSVQCLLYADCIVKFLKLHQKQLKSREAVELICPYSELVGNKILNTFTDTPSRLRPNLMRDKAVCYVMVITALACNYTVDLNTVSQAIGQLGMKKLAPIAKAIGLTQRTKDVWQLKLPLPEIPTFFKKRSQRR